MNGPQGPGFFGKIPARGDFLSRRVPSGIAAAWEAWLQDLTVTVRGSQPGWQDAWLTAPLWHFTLGAALAPPHGAAGVLVASADRVGRLYPFTIIGASASRRGGPERWAPEAEALALAALDDAYDPATLDAALLALGPPPPPLGPNRPGGLWPVTLDGDWPAALDALDHDGLAADDGLAGGGPGPDQSEWWCRGSDRVAPVRLRCTGLPSRRTAAAMVLGGEGVLVPDVLA